MTHLPERVDAADWVEHLTRLHGRGLCWLDFLTAIDRGTSVDVVVGVMDSVTAASALLVTRAVDALPSISAVYPGARWHERETHEMFGLVFTGLVDDRPLLVHDADAGTPLRKADRA